MGNWRRSILSYKSLNESRSSHHWPQYNTMRPKRKPVRKAQLFSKCYLQIKAVVNRKIRRWQPFKSYFRDQKGAEQFQCHHLCLHMAKTGGWSVRGANRFTAIVPVSGNRIPWCISGIVWTLLYLPVGLWYSWENRVWWIYFILHDLKGESPVLCTGLSNNALCQSRDAESQSNTKGTRKLWKFLWVRMILKKLEETAVTISTFAANH